MTAASDQTHYVYVDSVFADVEEAITIYRWNPEEGSLSRIGSVSEGTVNPFALAVDPSQRASCS